MRYIPNPWRGQPLPRGLAALEGEVLGDPRPMQALLARCPRYAATPMRDMGDLAEALGIGALSIKDESGRMGLGSFKALGAAGVIARAAAPRIDAGAPVDHALAGETYVAASAGNHGMSVAAGAAVFGAAAVIYLAETVSAAFAARLREKGATVVVEGADYEASMAAAEARAAETGWTLLSDSTWSGYLGGVGVMEGYLAMAAEAAADLSAPPTHIFLQAGVGGLAAACALHARSVWGDAPEIIVVEPEVAPALQASIEAGAPTHAPGPVSSMGRLDCKDASHTALKSLADTASGFLTISESASARGVAVLAEQGLATSPSGGAGFAGLLVASRDRVGLTAESRVLIYLSEGAEAA